MEWLGAISAALGILALVLKYVLREETKTEKALRVSRELDARRREIEGYVRTGKGADLDHLLRRMLDDLDHLGRGVQSSTTAPLERNSSAVSGCTVFVSKPK